LFQRKKKMKKKLIDVSPIQDPTKDYLDELSNFERYHSRLNFKPHKCHSIVLINLLHSKIASKLYKLYYLSIHCMGLYIGHSLFWRYHNTEYWSMNSHRPSRTETLTQYKLCRYLHQYTHCILSNIWRTCQYHYLRM